MTLNPKCNYKTFACLGLALFTTVALAGCVSSGSTASQLQMVADHNAENWHPDAELVMILGGEGTTSLQHTFGQWDVAALHAPAVAALANASMWDRVVDDPEPGDGRAEIWSFVYRAGESDRHLVLGFDRASDLLYEDELEQEPFSDTVRDYNVDSDQAVRIASQQEDAFTKFQEHERFTLTVLLVQEPEHPGPVWILLGATHGVEASGWRVIVDAKNGDLLQSEEALPAQ